MPVTSATAPCWNGAARGPGPRPRSGRRAAGWRLRHGDADAGGDGAGPRSRRRRRRTSALAVGAVARPRRQHRVASRRRSSASRTRRRAGLVVRPPPRRRRRPPAATATAPALAVVLGPRCRPPRLLVSVSPARRPRSDSSASARPVPEPRAPRPARPRSPVQPRSPARPQAAARRPRRRLLDRLGHRRLRHLGQQLVGRLLGADHASEAAPLARRTGSGLARARPRRRVVSAGSGC